MRTWIRAGWLAVFLVVGGCKERQPHKDASHEHHGEETDAKGATPTQGANALQIDHDMIRDLRITTATVEQRPGGDGVTILGELHVNGDAYAEVGPPIPSRVLRILASPGDVVRAGQSLAELQSVELGKARADYLRAQARAQLAQQAHDRKKGLAGERIVAEREVQEAHAEARAAEADLRAARAGLKALGVSDEDLGSGSDADTSRFALRSPIPGTVIERSLAKGQVTDPAKPLFRVGDLSLLWLEVHAFERDAVRVKVGATARVSFPALPGKTFSGAVALVGKQVEATSRTLPVRIDVQNQDGLLRPGMSASAWVPLGDAASTVVAVPAASVQRLEKGWSVFIPKGEEGAFEVRQVGRGRDLGGEVEIVSGLKPGETVVVDGAFLLKAEAEKARGDGEHHEH